MGWAKAWPSPEKENCGFWSSVGGEGDSGMPETASGGSSEAQEDSTPSAYDNLDKLSLQTTTEDVPGGHFETNFPKGHIGACEKEAEEEEVVQTRDSFSSWSSCEVLPLEENSDAAGAASPGISPKKPDGLPSEQVAGEEDGDKVKIDDHEVKEGDENHPNSLASCSVFSDSPLSTGSSEVFLPSGPQEQQGSEPLLQPRDTHTLLAELRQQMVQQKTEYQARIQR